MTPDSPPAWLRARYPTARIHGRLVKRSDETPLGLARIDAATAGELGRDHVGWFVGRYPGSSQAARQFARLAAMPEGGVWIVVPHSKDLSAQLWLAWPHSTRPATSPTPWWQSGRMWIAPPESLRTILPAVRQDPLGVAGILVLDPECHLHRSRGGTLPNGRQMFNDRPQHVVNFRTALAAEDWQPPLLLLTARQASAFVSEDVARAYCLEAFRFISGDSFACWEESIEPEVVPPAETASRSA